VLRRDTDEADYFVNAGKTSQRGIETWLSYDFINRPGVFSLFKIWGSYAYQNYSFREYSVVDEDFSGNKLTGIAPHTFSSGIDLAFLDNFSANFTLNYVDEIPVNDANSVYATNYFLLGLRAGWKTTFREKHLIEIFGGAENALDEKYSLGNDLNAFVAPGLNPVTAGRYYNAAMPRNFYAGVSISLGFRK
jgi:iron complex outermembrane receptor protein